MKIPVHSLYIQISNLATNLNKIECENYDRLRVETREFLQNFYVQLNNQPILFTAVGVFVINYTLFASIVTGVLGYQVSIRS
jgi:7tm Chemosensory receptor